MSYLRDKLVLVLGLGETGLSLVRWLNAQGARLRVADTRAAPPGLEEAAKFVARAELHCGPFAPGLLKGVGLIAISPGVPVDDPLVRRAIEQGIPVAGDIELFAQSLPATGRPKIIAITGSNGKTTVTSMVGAMCREAGLDTEVAGNISPAVLDALLARHGRQPDVWVLELSSFQLETTQSLAADAATVLNVTEDHLDRYADMDAYAAAKERIFIGCKTRVLNRDDPRSDAMAQAGSACVKFGIRQPQRNGDWSVRREDDATWLVQGARLVMNAADLRVTGLHNVANALAALALCRAVDLPLEPLCDALRDFRGLPHRVEKVAEICGVTYIDDSKGTNVGATEAALNGLGMPAVVILGGDGKGQDFTPLKAAVMDHARAAVLIGRDADAIAAALEGSGKPVVRAQDMADAVRHGAALAEPGDAVLLSPACASFDMFRNYQHRAEVFVAAVQQLKKEAPCSAV
ncbi:MAG TPA: UDP-N-acetylmuramoyl-L-alanine--D-glutamate ligase [Gallionellaceae bacterium]|nr:UDP-N-acetylmuramoyl-L-alanine--D-glutamate ligase [Gallionellaceae bacterium]